MTPQIETFDSPSPHLVIDEPPDQRYSHMSSDEDDVQGLVISAASRIVNTFTNRAGLTEPVTTKVRGILDGVTDRDDLPFKALLQAMSVPVSMSYSDVLKDWSDRTEAWTERKDPDGINPQSAATVVLTISDQEAAPILHNLVTIKDENGNMKAVSTAIEPYGVIPNATFPSTLSLYVNADRWLESHPHFVDVEINSETPYVTYKPIRDAAISGEFNAVVPNQTTYIDLRMFRDAGGTYRLYLANDPKVPGITNVPFPPLR